MVLTFTGRTFNVVWFRMLCFLMITNQDKISVIKRKMVLQKH